MQSAVQLPCDPHLTSCLHCCRLTTMLDAQPAPGAQPQQQQQPLQNGAARPPGHLNGGPAAPRPQPMQLPGERAQRWLTPEVRPSSMQHDVPF